MPMPEATLWDLRPVAVNIVYCPGRTAFTYDVATYDEWGLLAPEEGAFEYEFGLERGECEFGEYVLCPPGVPLRRKARGLFSFHFLRFLWRDAAAWPCGPEAGLPVGKVTVRDRQRLASNFGCLRSLASRREEPGGGRLADYVLRDLLLLPVLDPERGGESGLSLQADPLIAEAQRRISREADGEMSLKRLAAELGLRPAQLTRRFTAAAGVTPQAYLTGLRLRKARALLLETDLNLEDIAEQCGYGSGFYLSRLFSREVGMSPSRFRQLYRV